MILAADENWPAVVSNLSRAWVVWNRMTRIFSREGVEPWVSGFFFKTVAQAVTLFGAETWVPPPPCMRRVMGGLQYQVARILMGQISWRKIDGKGEYTSAATAREEAVFQTMEE